MIILASVLFTVFAWIFVGAIIIGCLYWVVAGILYFFHSIKDSFSTKNRKADVLDSNSDSGKSYNVRIDISVSEKEEDKE